MALTSKAPSKLTRPTRRSPAATLLPAPLQLPQAPPKPFNLHSLPRAFPERFGQAGALFCFTTGAFFHRYFLILTVPKSFDFFSRFLSWPSPGNRPEGIFVIGSRWVGR